MSIILHIESSGQNCSVAISKNNELLDCLERNEANLHASALTVFIKELIERNQIQFSELDAVSVSKGPGSYTGLRIGVSTAKGLCYALDKPLISVSTLASMTRAAIANIKTDLPLIYCPMIDARRMEVYTCLLDQNLNNLKNISAEILDENTFDMYLKESAILFFGDGSEKCKSLFENSANAHFLDNIYPSATFMVAEAFDKFSKQDFEDVAYFEPYYLKEFLFK